MSVSEHANYLLNEYGRLQFDYAAYCKPYGESLRNEARNNLEEYIAELEAERRWRVVADGELPEHDGEYWVWLEAWNTPDKRGACIYSKDYHDNNGFFNLIPVTHWMPLPQPPEVHQ